MNVQDRIRQELKRIMSKGEANACEIWKGYAMTSGLAGWHYKRFNGNATYLGNSEAEALDAIAEIADSREQMTQEWPPIA